MTEQPEKAIITVATFLKQQKKPQEGNKSETCIIKNAFSSLVHVETKIETYQLSSY